MDDKFERFRPEDQVGAFSGDGNVGRKVVNDAWKVDNNAPITRRLQDSRLPLLILLVILPFQDEELHRPLRRLL